VRCLQLLAQSILVYHEQAEEVCLDKQGDERMLHREGDKEFKSDLRSLCDRGHGALEYAYGNQYILRGLSNLEYNLEGPLLLLYRMSSAYRYLGDELMVMKLGLQAADLLSDLNDDCLDDDGAAREMGKWSAFLKALIVQDYGTDIVETEAEASLRAIREADAKVKAEAEAEEARKIAEVEREARRA